MKLRHILLAVIATVGIAAPLQAQMFSPGNGWVNDAAYALDRKQWDKGTELAARALQSGDVSPDNLPAAYNNYCIGLTGQRKFDAAIAACNKAVELRPREWRFYNNRANIYFYLNQFDRALAEYYKAMTFNPSGNVLMSNIGISLKQRRVFGNGPGGARDIEKQS